MNIDFSKDKLVNCDFEALILPIYEKEKFSEQLSKINSKLNNFISHIVSCGYFKPEFGNIHVVYPENKLKVKKILLLGMGKKKKINQEKLYQGISLAISYIVKTSVRKCAIYIKDLGKRHFQNIAEISILSTYKFNNYKTKKNKQNLKTIKFITEKNISQTESKKIANRAICITQGIFLARDLVNHPSNYLNPRKMSELVKEKYDKKIEITIYNEDEIEKMGMGLIKSVSSGSKEDGKLIILDYKPKKYNKTLALIGKGLTFDSGGLSLKPSEGMDLMKMDMAGAASVIGVFDVITKIKPKNIRIIGAIGAVENMQSHSAQRPGDIWKSYSGKTVEVLNTDAEGRLVLADVISFVQNNYKLDCLIDVATLTGACTIALGQEYAGLFGNNDKLLNSLEKNSKESYEKLWRMPINESFHNEVKSEIADLKNIGNGREADVCIAAAFLEEFVESDVKWAHLDIAGPAIITKPIRNYIPKGGSGFGVKTLAEFVLNTSLDIEK